MGLDDTSAELIKYNVMQATSFQKYPGYSGSVSPDGLVTIHDADTTTERISWALNSVDEACVETFSSFKANACGMGITQGTDCSKDTGNFYYKGTDNPYEIYYATQKVASQTASVGSEANVTTGYTGTQLNGKTFIVFDSNGERAACAVIERSPLSDIPGGVCFPGDALASVRGRGAVALADLTEGDAVLVQRPSGELAYEPLLGFLHATKGASRFVTVQHAGGELRASANHLAFVAGGGSKLVGELRAGDELLVAHGEAETPTASAVLAVRVEEGDAGMVAPFTMAGSIVVDGTVASAYATHSPAAFIPHGVLHALFFPARMLARASFGRWATGPSAPKAEVADEAMHPLANLYARALIPFAKNVLEL
jgi:hypothetical protein